MELIILKIIYCYIYFLYLSYSVLKLQYILSYIYSTITLIILKFNYFKFCLYSSTIIYYFSEAFNHVNFETAIKTKEL